MKLLKVIKKNWPETILFTILFLFSLWLMWHTFNYKNGMIYIATKAWSDFAANIPLIRSFSWGKNWPPEYPLFPGEPIKYHFLFYFLVGMLEKIGLPISWALNLPSTVVFFALLVLIYLLTKLLFKSRMVGFLTIIFFLFNGSFSFLEFFKTHPLSLKTPLDIITNTVYPSFAPYGPGMVSAFWNLNIYTNQRHLALAYFSILFIIYIFFKSIKMKKEIKSWQIIFMGIIFGLMPFFHKVAFIMTGVILFSLFLYFPKLRRPIFLVGLIAGFLALPQLVYQFEGGTPTIFFRPGYLIAYPLTATKIISYWFQNLGLSLILIPIGFLLANKEARLLFLSVLPLFLIGNLFQFSQEIAGNHKFFNFFLIVGNMFVAWVIYLICKKNVFGKIVTSILVFFLVFSGIIDFFPIKNDAMSTINDAPKNPDIMWIKENTPSDAVFLNSSYLYHPASLAGRKIFLGWPYFAWSAGYDTNQRGKIMKEIYENRNPSEICRLLKENRIDYFTVEDVFNDLNLPKIESNFFKDNFVPVYANSTRSFYIYKTDSACQKFTYIKFEML